MASNFQIYSFKTNNSLHLKLTGDFDGSSAHELINTLIEHGTGFWNIFIDTDNLKTIHPFGRDVFQKNLNNFKKQLNNLTIIGANKYNIAPN
jgi:hypothetical protein